MGKGNRNSQKRIEENVKNSAKNLEKQKKANNQKKTDKAVSIALSVFALLIVVVLAFSVVTNNGVFIRAEAAMTTENVKVDSAMMNFFYNNYLSNWYNQYGTYIEQGYFSLNPAASLKLQNYGGGYEIYFIGQYDGTWYDYFLDAVSEEVETYILYAEGAIEAGLTLTDEDNAAIDELIDGIKASLKEAGASFSDWYGTGVKASDVRRAYELVYLAENFMEYKQEKLKEALDADDAALIQYVEDNKAMFYTADVLKYTITTVSKDFESDMDFDLAKKLAKEEAEKIMAAKTPEEFASLVAAYEAAKDAKTETEESTEEGTEESTEEAVDTEKYETTVSYQVNDDLGKWLFEEKAELNATKVIEATNDKEETIKGETKEDGTKTEDQKIAYKEHTATVYFVTDPMHLDTDLTKSVGYFISDDKALVEEFINEFKASSTKNYEEFQKAAEAFAEELHAGHDHSDENTVEPVLMFEGIEKLQDGYFPDPYTALGDWIDADDHEENTFSEITEIVVDKEKNTVYYGVAYFEKYCEETWYVNAYNATISQQFEDWAENQEKNVTPITVNNKAVTGSITPLAWSVGTSTDSHEGHDHD